MTKMESASGVDYIFTGLPIPFFNIAMLTGDQLSAAALEALAHGATQYASDRNAPWLLIVTHEALEPGVDATAVLDGCGLTPILPLTGMIAARISTGPAVPAGLQLEVPEDDGGCGDLIDVNSAAYDMDLSASGGHRYVLLVAAERFGERPTFRHATDAGRPIYARMGYEAVASHTCFFEKRLLAGH